MTLVQVHRVYNILKSQKINNRIIITHDLSLAYKLGYKIIYMKDGRIEFFDDNSKFSYFELESEVKKFSSFLINVTI